MYKLLMLEGCNTSLETIFIEKKVLEKVSIQFAIVI